MECRGQTGRPVKRSFRGEAGVGTQGFIREVKPAELGEQLRMETEKTGWSRMTPKFLGN